MIDITLLGTGALLPLPERALTAAMLRCGGCTMLFDCGEGTQTAARKHKAGLSDISVIALTHYHGDHIFGLPGLLQTLGTQGRITPLHILGPGNIRRELAPILRLAGGVPFPVILQGVPKEGITLQDLDVAWPREARLTAFATKHRVASQGYAFTLSRPAEFLPDKAREMGLPVILWNQLQHGEPVQWEGRTVKPDQVTGEARRGLKFVFSGDTAPCETLMEASQEADLLICEATYGDDSQQDTAFERGHMTFAQAAQTARDAGVRRLWLSHYSQMIQDPQEHMDAVRRIYPEAVCGNEGMKIQLCFDV
ncbi:MAG: ribonuclease Z [Clostridia bacterium]|nr:ribonuclease Z [Clostridia bacterium]